MEIRKYFLDDEDPIEAEESIKPADPEEEGITEASPSSLFIENLPTWLADRSL